MCRLLAPTAVDVFCGCGGLTTGLVRAGFRVLAGIEIDPAALLSYAASHPAVRLFPGDVRDLTASHILESLQLREGELDLLAGCSPCQGFSRMRTRNRRGAVDDERNDLVLDFVRLTEGLMPKTLVFENVPGLLHDGRFDELKRRLTSKGYFLDHRVVDLADYGIPQRRRRLILVGSRLRLVVVPQAQNVKCNVRSAIGSLPPPQESNDMIHRSVSVHSTPVMERIKRIPKNGGGRLDLGSDSQLRCHTGFDGYRDVYGRMAWDKPAPTITRYSFNPSKGRYLHPDQDREITLREAALLQSFPPDYRFPLEECGRGAVASMIGEALPPKIAEVLGRHILLHLQDGR